MKRLSTGKSILLFRFHKDIETSYERVKIIQDYNPGLPVHVLFGGDKKNYDNVRTMFRGLAESTWLYVEDKSKDWKWKHTDLMTKDWFRDFGHKLHLDFLYSYEYDLLTLKPLIDIYPDIDENTLALAAVEKLDDVEWTWSWTSAPAKRKNYLLFRDYMQKTYDLERQKYVCLGPGPLLPRRFIDRYATAEDVDFVHEEITLPAYAEVFGFNIKDHGMHPGFKLTSREKYFICRDDYAAHDYDIKGQLAMADGIRAFHPVKQLITLDSILLWEVAPSN